MGPPVRRLFSRPGWHELSAVPDPRGARTALLTPLPAQDGLSPESGVAQYALALVENISPQSELIVLGQRSLCRSRVGSFPVVRTWDTSMRLPFQVLCAVRRHRISLLHVQQEFRLYGGVAQGLALTLALLVARVAGLRVVTTIHGVVHPGDVTGPWLRQHGFPPWPRGAKVALRAAYSLIAAASDVVVVHHDYFRRVLVRCYGIRRREVRTIKMGSSGAARPISRARPPYTILVFGFLTGYKRPEVVVELAESGSLPDARFLFCVGKNPRDASPAYESRYRELRARVESLGPQCEWMGYAPDDVVPDLFRSAVAVLLPYTECVSASAVASMAREFGVPVCHSAPLRPLFGSGPLEFDLEPNSLRAAILAAVEGVTAAEDPFVPWAEMADATAELWLSFTRV